MIVRLRWWWSLRVAAHRSARAGSDISAALAHRELDRIRYRRP
jgi:hypothetical protein